MSVGLYDTDANFQLGIETIHDKNIKSGISFIRAAMAISSQEKTAPLDCRDAVCFIFPSDDMLEMFANDPNDVCVFADDVCVCGSFVGVLIPRLGNCRLHISEKGVYMVL
jgi:hypothetical protein